MKVDVRRCGHLGKHTVVLAYPTHHDDLKSYIYVIYLSYMAEGEVRSLHPLQLRRLLGWVAKAVHLNATYYYFYQLPSMLFLYPILCCFLWILAFHHCSPSCPVCFSCLYVWLFSSYPFHSLRNTHLEHNSTAFLINPSPCLSISRSQSERTFRDRENFINGI